MTSDVVSLLRYPMQHAERTGERFPKVLEMVRAAARGDFAALEKTDKSAVAAALDMNFVAPLIQVVGVGSAASVGALLLEKILRAFRGTRRAAGIA